MKTKLIIVMLGVAALMSACDGGTQSASVGPDDNLIVDPPYTGGGCVLKVIPGAEVLTVPTGVKDMVVQGGEAVNDAMRSLFIRKLQHVAYTMKDSCVQTSHEGDSSSAAPAMATADHTATGTNVQEAGVGEWDSMQTDGTHLYTVVGNQIHVSRIYPVAEAKRLAQIAINGNVQGIALSDSSLAVISSVSLPKTTAPEMSKTSIAWQSPTHTQLTLLDVANPSAPKVRTQRLFAGSWVAGRHHGGQFQLVLKTDMFTGMSTVPHSLPISTPCGPDGKPADPRAWKAALVAELEKQSDIIRKMDFVSHITDDVNAGDTAQFYDNPSAVTGQFLRVIRVAIADASAQKVMVSGGGSIVYASKTSVYVADQTIWGHISAIHRFSADERLAYAGTVEVDGSVLNSFSMGEDEGVLRVATTIGFDTSNVIYTFRLGTTTMEPWGKLKDVAPSERIYAVRYIGKRGYVVTFRQIDPLHVVDFSDPSAPKILGELQIPGYSAYLHPLGDTHLIGVGMSANMTPKISLFDISDAAQPKETDTNELTAYKSSVLSDHHAFTFDAASGLLALPSSSGYRLFRVDAAKGISSVGTTETDIGYLSEYESRSIIMSDGDGTHLVTMGKYGIKIRKTDATLSVEKSLDYTSN